MSGSAELNGSTTTSHDYILSNDARTNCRGKQVRDLRAREASADAAAEVLNLYSSPPGRVTDYAAEYEVGQNVTTADSLDACDDPVRIRKATLADVPAIRPLIATSARILGAGDYTGEQIEAARRSCVRCRR